MADIYEEKVDVAGTEVLALYVVDFNDLSPGDIVGERTARIQVGEEMVLARIVKFVGS